MFYYFTLKIRNTVRYARTNVIGSRTSFVIASFEIYEFRGNIPSRSTFTTQHKYLSRKNIIQNQKYKCKNNIKLIYYYYYLLLLLSYT